MTLSQLVFRSMQKNIKQYYLYFFALIFSVTLFFSFNTLQYNGVVLEATKESGTATVGFKVASYMLYVIILFFVLYANHLFMKRRSKEVGLYQLIGMKKGLVVRLIAYENILLFTGAVAVGIAVGYLTSRLFAMILLKILQFDSVIVGMSFSMEAFVQTMVIFAVMLVIILIQQMIFIRRVSLLSLFTAVKQADERVKRIGWLQMLLGAIGIVLIIYGYYKSTVLFDFSQGDYLFRNMALILATTIGGTFFVFRFSVTLIMNLIRMKKNGHVTTTDVTATTPIMHRMKGNAKSLTLITVLTAISLAITTLSYIAYYSIDASVKSSVPAHFLLMDDQGEPFFKLLEDNEIAYTSMDFPFTEASIKLDSKLDEVAGVESFIGGNDLTVSVISQTAYKQVDADVQLVENEVIVAGYGGQLGQFIQFKTGGTIEISAAEEQERVGVKVAAVHEQPVLGSGPFISGSPMLVVADELFQQLKQSNQDIERIVWTKQTSVQIVDEVDLKQADTLYVESGSHKYKPFKDSEHFYTQQSQEMLRSEILQVMGIIIFVTAFLGLAFLLATGSILYFKQMSEADEEKGAYTILRKIGFSEQELMRGIYKKQLFNFGVPLTIGLLHSYFAVKSGWFLFGTQLITPLIVTMTVYIALYTVFSLLSIQYYKRVIKEAL